mgnify:CR=1 FL=1
MYVCLVLFDVTCFFALVVALRLVTFKPHNVYVMHMCLVLFEVTRFFERLVTSRLVADMHCTKCRTTFFRCPVQKQKVMRVFTPQFSPFVSMPAKGNVNVCYGNSRARYPPGDYLQRLNIFTFSGLITLDIYTQLVLGGLDPRSLARCRRIYSRMDRCVNL